MTDTVQMMDATLQREAAEQLKNTQILQSLAQQCVTRMQAQGLKGKARNTAAIEFWCGAMALAESLESNSTLSRRLSLFGFFSLQRDGFAAVEKLAKGA